MAHSNETPSTESPTGLQPREFALVQALLDGKSYTDACRIAGYAESTARARAGEICERPRVQSAIAQALAHAGLSPDVLVELLKSGLTASDIDGPDWSARHKFLETALRLGGHNPSRETSFEESYEERILKMRGLSSSPSTANDLP